MDPLSSTFNATARYQALLILLWFWISASLDAERRERKIETRRLSRRITEQPKIAPQPLRVPGFR